MALELARLDKLGTYFSGYPVRKLRSYQGVSVRSFPARTLVVYGARRLLPELLRPKDRHLFRWQDWSFDRRVAAALQSCDFFHGLPGQCRESFRRAKEMGIQTVLSHATGPVDRLEESVAPEYERVGREFGVETQYDAEYYKREAEEYALADFHWAASSVVAERLREGGVASSRIWTIPYGVDTGLFSLGTRKEQRIDAKTYRIVFAGQLSLRKGIRHVLDALTLLGDVSIEFHFYGQRMAEVEDDLRAYQGASGLHFHGPLAQEKLAEAFRHADLLVLPSLEEGYGLVVNQALACGLPCLVSDRVGAKDAIVENENGMVVAVGDAPAWAEAINSARAQSWSGNEISLSAPSWSRAAEILVDHSEAAAGSERTSSN